MRSRSAPRSLPSRTASAPSRLRPRSHSGCRSHGLPCGRTRRGRRSTGNCPRRRRRTRSATATHRSRACRAARCSRWRTPYRCRRRAGRRSCRATPHTPEMPTTADDAGSADALRPSLPMGNPSPHRPAPAPATRPRSRPSAGRCRWRAAIAARSTRSGSRQRSPAALSCRGSRTRARTAALVRDQLGQRGAQRDIGRRRLWNRAAISPFQSRIRSRSSAASPSTATARIRSRNSSATTLTSIAMDRRHVLDRRFRQLAPAAARCGARDAAACVGRK